MQIWTHLNESEANADSPYHVDVGLDPVNKTVDTALEK